MAEEEKIGPYETEIRGFRSFAIRSHAENADQPQNPMIAEMRANRKVNAELLRRTSAVGSSPGMGGGPSLSFATGRPRDPLWYWRQNNVPYEIENEEHLNRVRMLCRLLYLTHPIIASAIDIFSTFPLSGMELSCKDEAIKEFHETLFFDDLDYEEFLINLGRAYWTEGEACSLGSFNELLGVWEDDELIRPDDVKVIQSPFLKEPRYEMRLPTVIREIIEKREPKWEFDRLMRWYPEFGKFAGKDAMMPVSNVLLKRLVFRADNYHHRGVPLLMRVFRAVMQEEMIMAAMDSIASRLYTPLILAKLGASATDLGTQVPWIPNDEDLGNFEAALDAALAADFRVITHHFALQMESVFGREIIPQMTDDFERLEARILQGFGLSQTALNGAGQGETYAADALNLELASQLMRRYQKMIKRYYRDRALVVAEAQEHYDYEERGGKRYPIMEEVLEVDGETGEQRIVEQPKLLVPELNIKVVNLQQETARRQLVEALRESGVPISDTYRVQNVDIDLKEQREIMIEENVDKAVAAGESRRQTYLALQRQGLPIPEDLKSDFEPHALGGQEEQPAAADQGAPLPSIAFTEGAPVEALVPNAEDQAMVSAPNGNGAAPPPAGPPPVQQLPRNRLMDTVTNPSRPPQSDERRAGMPRASARQKAIEEVTRTGPTRVRALIEMREKSVAPPEGSPEGTAATIEREPVYDEVDVEEGRMRLVSGPRHIGLRRYAGLSRDTPIGETEESD